MSAFWSGVVAGYGIAVPVGAIAILIIETSMRSSLRKGLAAGAGAATADFVYATAAVLGGSGIAAAVGDTGPVFNYIGGALLVVMAILGIRRALQAGPVSRQAGKQGGMAATYAAFLGLTLVNPATVIYFVAVVMGLGLAAGMTPVQGASFVVGAGLASLSWQWLLAWAGSSLGARLTGSSRKWIGVAGNLVVLALAAVIFLGGS
ncbi:MAG: LysE family transporter [Actinomycetes bacterium]|jgi:threonine/homoserine/homoserine lactone efflux protein